MTTAIDDYRAAVPAYLDRWDLADPGQLLRDLGTATPLVAGRSLLCQVGDARPGGQPSDGMRARDALEEAMRRLGHRDFEWDEDERLTSVVITVIIRDGRAVPRRSDGAVDAGLRYANNPFQALRGETLIATPHGWISLPDRLADPVAVVPGPRDVQSARRHRRV